MIRLPTIAAWLRRAGPAKSLGLALVGVNALFFGCISWSEGTRWGWDKRETPAPIAKLDRLVRVRLMGRTPKPSVELSITSPFAVANGATGAAIVPENAPLESAVIRPAGAGIQLGAKTIQAGDILITPIRDAAIVLNGQTYRGSLRVQRVGGGLALANHVDIESYLRGVLRGELPRSFHLDSFKAQCVAARTYALYQKQHNAADSSFDVYDDEGSQMYVGVRGEDGISDRAVRETVGEVCTCFDGHESKIFCTYYSSACGGVSQPVRNAKPNDPDVPPLSGNVKCTDCSGAKFYRWEPVKLSKAEVTKRLSSRYPNLRRLGTIMNLIPKSKTPDGRIIRMELVGSGGTKETLVGEDFRLSIGGRVLKSTNFDIQETKDAFIFKDGKGFGHGMGLCQYGMDGKAKRGMDYQQILQTYYPGALIKKLY